MNHCYKSGHHSVLEFADFTFKISGVSRALTHQLVRHRLASYAQRSQRYCKETGFEFVVPPSIAKTPEAAVIYQKTMDNITEAYAKLLELQIPGEDARMVLPNACFTEICVKMNLRTFMNFCNERLCSCAQWEIRQMAMQMVKEVLKVAPELKQFLVPKCEKHPNYHFCTETKKRSCGRHPLISEVFSGGGGLELSR
jgi:thymidylate synthase (FAD)